MKKKKNATAPKKPTRPKLKVHHTSPMRRGTATGAHITKVRTAAGLSTASFARLLDVTPGTIVLWEARGKKMIKADPTRRALMTKLAKLSAKTQGTVIEDAVWYATKFGVLGGFGRLALRVAQA
jgi:DNA-binding transcriptional regulator YiaG